MLEELAKVQHEIWSHWMTYLFKVSILNKDGSVTIPADKVEQWKKLTKTDYSDLTDEEKKSDLDQARKVVTAVNNFKK